MVAIRFEAGWIEKQHRDSDGEWNPDMDEFAASYHDSRVNAELSAIKSSKAAGQCEWIQVTEQAFVKGEWADRRIWVGDWDGLHDEIVSIGEELD